MSTVVHHSNASNFSMRLLTLAYGALAYLVFFLHVPLRDRLRRRTDRTEDDQ